MYLPRYQLYICNRTVYVWCCGCDSSLRNLNNKYEWSLRLSVSISPEQGTMSGGSGWLGLERPRSCGQWQELTAVRLGCSVGTSRQAEQSVSVAPRHTSNTNIHLTINLIAGPSSIISSATATQQPQLDYCRVLCPKTFITGHLCIRVCFLIYKASRRNMQYQVTVRI